MVTDANRKLFYIAPMEPKRLVADGQATAPLLLNDVNGVTALYKKFRHSDLIGSAVVALLQAGLADVDIIFARPTVVHHAINEPGTCGVRHEMTDHRWTQLKARGSDATEYQLSDCMLSLAVDEEEITIGFKSGSNAPMAVSVEYMVDV